MNADGMDVQLVERSSVSSEDPQMLMIAQLAAQRLNEHYPNHWWMIGWAPGMTLVVKHGMGDARYGYTVDAAKAASITQLEQAIIFGGGELLERMNLPRGAWNGVDEPTSYDGAPPR